jgi:hypothetical protein
VEHNVKADLQTLTQKVDVDVVGVVESAECDASFTSNHA